MFVQVDWDCDDSTKIERNLPDVVEVDDNVSFDDIPDIVSDKYEFCVKGFAPLN